MSILTVEPFSPTYPLHVHQKHASKNITVCDYIPTITNASLLYLILQKLKYRSLEARFRVGQCGPASLPFEPDCMTSLPSSFPKRKLSLNKTLALVAECVFSIKSPIRDPDLFSFVLVRGSSKPLSLSPSPSRAFQLQDSSVLHAFVSFRFINNARI